MDKHEGILTLVLYASRSFINKLIIYYINGYSVMNFFTHL